MREFSDFGRFFYNTTRLSKQDNFLFFRCESMMLVKYDKNKKENKIFEGYFSFIFALIYMSFLICFL